MRDTEYATMHEQEMVHWWFRGRRVLLRDLRICRIRQHDSLNAAACCSGS